MTEFLTAPTPFRSVLIANRGEIAVRIIRTCRRLGLKTVAVYSEADRNAPHVRLADTALCIGPDAPAESYLKIPAVISAATAGGAEAVHPGYGFLSENADFVRACEETGLIFVGPSSDAVARMGSKIKARRLAEAAGVPTVPGYDAVNASIGDLKEAAERIGYPVMIKANSGGGGRGMRRVAGPHALEAAVASARHEAGASFGDESIFLEKLIESPRHLEVQVFGDGQGGALHFYERDCSVQRNHQKVIEEAPAPNLPEAVRQTLLDSALKLTRAMRYAGAGTVEFIMEASGDAPYFLEMNTRLQVEHPVTEEICGVDLVEFQLRQAAGLPMLLRQDQIVPRGHALEVRINAERPGSGFLPGTGTFVEVAPPDDLRFESGVETGSAVGTQYDSMLAKLVAHGPNRDWARLRLIEGLERLRMSGVATNQAFLLDCLRADSFAQGTATTSFLDETFPHGWQPDDRHLLRLRGAVALFAARQGSTDSLRRRDGFRVMRGRRSARSAFLVRDDYGEVELSLTLGPKPAVAAEEETLGLDGVCATICEVAGTFYAVLDGLAIAATVVNAAEARLGGAGLGLSEGQIAAPLTGLVTKVYVGEGDTVVAGRPLIEMEAMKLVHTLSAPFNGTVTKVASAEGDTVQAKTVLIEIEEQV